MRRLDRAGIFRALPISWLVHTSKTSQAVAVGIEFRILDQLDGSDWVSWEGYEEHTVFGDFYVVKKDGSINTTIVEQLARSLGWSGDLRQVSQRVPDVVVQITVKSDEWNGMTRFKANWLNPGDYVPQGGTSSAGNLGAVEARFGSLLRAAAAAAMPKTATKPQPARPAPSAPPPAPAAGNQSRCPISDEPLDASDPDEDRVPF